MKTLTLFRHAKSSWDNPDLKDIDRPLLIKGIRRTDLMGEYLVKNCIKPDSIITSPAKRAYETGIIIHEHFRHEPEVKTAEVLYDGNANEIMDFIKTLPNNNLHVMLIGHNPILTDLANSLVHPMMIDWIPTSGMVRIEFDVTGWEAIKKHTGKMLEFIKPKQLKNK